jgi:hypothetical protein
MAALGTLVYHDGTDRLRLLSNGGTIPLILFFDCYELRKRACSVGRQDGEGGVENSGTQG